MIYTGKWTTAAITALHIGVGVLLWQCFGPAAMTSLNFWLAVSLLAVSAFLCGLIGRKLDRMAQLAMKDTLTGLYNRRYIARVLPGLLKRSCSSGQRFTISMVDVNDFKQINDTFGHQAGDVVIQHIAFAIARSLKKGEVAARWGGDEFIVLSTQGERERNTLKEQIEEKLQPLSAKHQIDLSVSVGSASCPDDAGSIDELLHVADERMFGTKCRCKEQRQTQELHAKIG